MTDADKDEQFYRDTESIAFPKLYDHQLSFPGSPVTLDYHFKIDNDSISSLWID
jgi:hypothetical protein